MNALSRTLALSGLFLGCWGALLGPAGAAEATQSSSSPDVLVVGGTAAGVAAAVAAARSGETVTLVSADGDLGDILSDGMMDQWDLNLAPDGAPLEGGLFTRMYDRLGEAFSGSSATQTLAALVASEPRIGVRYDERAVAVTTSGDTEPKRIQSVVFADDITHARTTIAAPEVIDATDDADVAALAGARYDLGRQDTGVDEGMQPVTEMFALDDVAWNTLERSYDAARFGPGGATGRSAWGFATLMRGYRPLDASVAVRDLNFGREADGTVTVNAIDVFGIDGLDPKQIARARQSTIAEAPHLLDFLRTNLPGFERARIVAFAAQVYVRETRHIAGLERLTTADVWLGRIPPDTIGLASYPIDVHPVTPSDDQPFAPIRHIYGVPFGALIPEGIDNLVLASPAISASHLAAGSVRTIPTTIEEGEAAGVASALARRDRVDIAQLAVDPTDIVQLRQALTADGTILNAPAAARIIVASARSAA